MSDRELMDDMVAYVTACRRSGDRRDALEIVARSGLWRAKDILRVLGDFRG